MFVGQSAGVGKTGRIAETQKKDNMKIVQYCKEKQTKYKLIVKNE